MSINQLVVLFLACGTLTLAASLVELQATKVSSITNDYLSFYYASLAGAKDLAFTTNKSTKESFVLKRDSNGMYNTFATKQLANVSLVATTNGEWFGSMYGLGIELFRVEQNGQVHDYSVIETATNDFVAKVQEDGSLMVAYTDSILTYEYINAAWVVTQNSSFPGANFDLSSFVAAAIPDNAFIVVNNKLNADNATVNICVITRQADKLWKIVETIAVNSTLVTSGQAFFWDGADTLIGTVINIEGSYPIGAVIVFTKNNGEWDIAQSISAQDAGVNGIGYFGVGPLIALDKNNVLVAAPADNVLSEDLPLEGGSVYLMQRNQQNQWTFVARFKSNMTLFSAGMARNDQDALVLGCETTLIDGFQVSCSLFTISTCVVEPIDYTCGQKRDSCSTNLDNLDSVVVINNPSCGQVSTSIDRVAADKNGIVVDVTLSRALVADAKCSVTLTCPELTSVMSGQALIAPVATFITALIAILIL